jgi:hypothetical protein
VAADVGSVNLSEAGTFADKNVGTSKVVTAASTLSGAEANNYTLIQPTGLSADISRASLTVTANDAQKTQGQNNPVLTATISGFVNNETLATSGVTGAASVTTTATVATPEGTAVITAGVGTLAASNYEFNPWIDGTLTIHKAVIQAISGSSNSSAAWLGPQLAAISTPTLAVFSPIVAQAIVPTPGRSPAPSDVAMAGPTSIVNNEAIPVTSMTGLQVRNLTPEQLNVLPIEQIINLKPVQLQALTTTQLSQLKPEVVENLSPSQLSVMSPRQLQALPNATASDSQPKAGTLSITILNSAQSHPASAAVAYEQNAETVSLKTINAPPASTVSDKVVFTDKVSTFLVAKPNGEMIEFQGSLVDNRMVIIAPSGEAKNLARSEMNLVLAAAVTSLGKETRVMLSQLEGVVLDLR